MARPDQINEALREALAVVVNRQLELPNVLVTVTFAKCSKDLKYATVGVSVLPETWRGTALKRLRAKSSEIAGGLKNHLTFRRWPKLRWVIDSTESRAEVVEQALAAEAAELKKIIKD